MKFSVADLLDQLSTDQSVSRATLAKILKLTNKADKAALELAAEALAKVGVLEVLENGELQRLENEELIDARLRCSSKGFCFAIRDDGGDDIYVRDHQLNHAWNGDRVLVRVIREGVGDGHRGWCPVHSRTIDSLPPGPGETAGRATGRLPPGRSNAGHHPAQ